MIEKIRIEFIGFFQFDSDYIVIYLNYCSDVDFCNFVSEFIVLKRFLKKYQTKSRFWQIPSA